MKQMINKSSHSFLHRDIKAITEKCYRLMRF